MLCKWQIAEFGCSSIEGSLEAGVMSPNMEVNHGMGNEKPFGTVD